MQATLAGGRGAVAIVPDARDLARLDAALDRRPGARRARQPLGRPRPVARYTRWLAVRRGQVLAVAGTRAAAYAPVADPGLFVIWDDGDDLHREPRAPYPDTRDVLALRSSHTGAALLIAGHVRSTQAQQLIESGWAHAIAADRAVLRASAPRVLAAGDDIELERDPAARAARLPSLAWRAARDRARRRRARPRPGRARRLRPGAGLRARPDAGALRALRRPAAHERGRRHPGLRVVRAARGATGAARNAASRGCGRSASAPAAPPRSSAGRSRARWCAARAATTSSTASTPGQRIVVATPGAEPLADGGYGAALLLDAPALLARQDLRAGEEALRRWMNAAALVRPARRS